VYALLYRLVRFYLSCVCTNSKVHGKVCVRNDAYVTERRFYLRQFSICLFLETCTLNELPSRIVHLMNYPAELYT